MIENWAASEWLAATGAFASALTAVFTGIVARIERRKYHGGMEIDWQVEHLLGYGPTATCTVRNTSRQSLEVLYVKVTGPVAQMQVSRGGVSHDHVAVQSKRITVGLRVAPGKSGTFSLRPTVDLEQAKRRAWLRKPTYWLARSLWRLLDWRLPVGCKVRISAMILPSSSSWRPKRITHSIRISEQMLKHIELNATKAAPMTGS